MFRNSVYNSGDDGHLWLAELVNLRELLYGQTNFVYDEGIPYYIAELRELVEYDCSYTHYKGSIDGWIFEGLENLGKVCKMDTLVCAL